MASGIFPISVRDSNGKKLLEAKRLIEAVENDLYDDCREAGQCLEDALVDGIHIGALRAAATACEDAVS